MGITRSTNGGSNYGLDVACRQNIHTGCGDHPASIQWVSEVPSLGMKRPERETGQSCVNTIEMKNEWGYTSAPSVCLRAPQYKFIFAGSYAYALLVGKPVGKGMRVKE
jgi:hypothetical protein